MKQLILNKDIWSISTKFIDTGSTIGLCTEGGAAENVEEPLNSKYRNKYSGFLFCYALFISIYFSRPSPRSDFLVPSSLFIIYFDKL